MSEFGLRFHFTGRWLPFSLCSFSPKIGDSAYYYLTIWVLIIVFRVLTRIETWHEELVEERAAGPFDIKAAEAAIMSSPLFSNDLLRPVVETKLKELSQVLTGIEAGSVALRDVEIEQIAADITSRANKEIWATSLIDPEQWWLRPVGKEHALLDREIINRGVNVRRVFISTDRRETAPRRLGP